MLQVDIVESWVSVKHGKWGRKITHNPTILIYVILISWDTKKLLFFPINIVSWAYFQVITFSLSVGF